LSTILSFFTQPKKKVENEGVHSIIVGNIDIWTQNFDTV
jgi:hypothetical protein